MFVCSLHDFLPKEYIKVKGIEKKIFLVSILLRCLLLRHYCCFRQQCRSDIRLCRKDDISMQNSFDIVAVTSKQRPTLSKLHFTL